jgi:hypothetical protein
MVTPPLAGAPYGKIVLGDADDRGPTSQFEHFLRAQTIQPVVTIDTSWLSVGHVDEIMSFVAAPRQPRRWVLLLASLELAAVLLGRSLDHLVRGMREPYKDPTPLDDDDDDDEPNADFTKLPTFWSKEKMSEYYATFKFRHGGG